MPQAAELYEGIDGHQEAVDIYIVAGLWDKARALSRSAAAARPRLASYVEDAYREHLLANEEADQLVQSGSVVEGLEMYARQGLWQKVGISKSGCNLGVWCGSRRPTGTCVIPGELLVSGKQ